jgi:hypothetical protein
MVSMTGILTDIFGDEVQLRLVAGGRVYVDVPMYLSSSYRYRRAIAVSNLTASLRKVRAHAKLNPLVSNKDEHEARNGEDGLRDASVYEEESCEALCGRAGNGQRSKKQNSEL